MRVAGDEQFRVIFRQDLTDARGVTTRITADVSHADFDAGDRKKGDLREAGPECLPVDIAIDCPKRGDLRQLVRQFFRADVARMPDLVEPLEIFNVTLVPVGVRVRE